MSRDKAREELEQQLRTFVGQETGPAHIGPDPVNEVMIRHWCEVMGDQNPIYTDPEAARAAGFEGIVAPPTMLHTWVMPGLPLAYPEKLPRDKQRELHDLLDRYGYTGVVATNTEQAYHRYLRPGDRISATTVIESISEQKATALGIGYFIETRDVFRDQNGEEVGWMTFRVLKFRPEKQPAAATSAEQATSQPARLRPVLAHDNAWWWEGVQRGELLIQKCSSCGVLRHPPRPMCGRCQSLEWETVRASGRGTVHSYTVVHHPKVPGYEYPLACVLVELEEGTRLVSNLVDCPPSQVRVGMPVELTIRNVEEDWKLPFFRPVS